MGTERLTAKARSNETSSRARPRTSGKDSRNPERTRARILAAAEEEFSTKGFDGARLQHIANGAKVQQALIYHYFADKESLYEEVMRAGIASTSEKVLGLVARVTDAVAAKNGKRMKRPDIETLIGAFFDLLTEFYMEHAALVAMLGFEARSSEPRRSARVSGRSPDDGGRRGGSRAKNGGAKNGKSNGHARTASRAVKFVEERVRPMFDAVVMVLEQMTARGDIRPGTDARQFALSAVSMIAYPLEEHGLVRAVWPDEESLVGGRRAAVVRLLTDALIG